MANELTFGADIEYIATNRINKQPFSIEGLLKGTKHNPFLVDKGNVQEDNVLPEMAIDVCHSKEEFVDKILSVQNQLKMILDKYNLDMVIESHGFFNPEQMNTEQAKTFGCDPDYNCWTYMKNPAPVLSKDNKLLRTAGGHVHFGFPEKHKWDGSVFEMAQWMDIFLGIQSVDKDKKGTMRRQLYGRAGAFRDKDYGVEYRVLSNWWATKSGAEWVYDQVLRAYEFFQQGTVAEIFGDIKNEVQKVINIGDPVYAKQFFSKRGMEYV